MIIYSILPTLNFQIIMPRTYVPEKYIIPYSFEQKHISIRNMSWFEKDPKNWYLTFYKVPDANERNYFLTKVRSLRDPHFFQNCGTTSDDIKTKSADVLLKSTTMLKEMRIT